MKEYIDLAEAKSKAVYMHGFGQAKFVSVANLEKCKAADVVERKHGEWEDEYGGAFANPRYRCSVCKEKALYRHEQDCLGGWHEVQALTDFCPNCGADMRGEKNAVD